MNGESAARKKLDPEEKERGGAALSFEEVYRLHGKALFNYLCYQLGAVEKAEDAFGDLCERLYRNLHRYDPRKAPLVSWLFSIARNSVRDIRRRRPRLTVLPLSPLSEPASGRPTPEESLIRRDQLESLLHAVQRLDRREREIVGMKFSAGLTNQSIARLLRLREGTVAVILHRAIRHLKGFVGEEDAR